MQGYAWAVSAGINAALAAISAKFFSYQPESPYVSISHTNNFATNSLSSGLAGFFFFEEALQYQWFLGAVLVIMGAIILSKSSKEEKSHPD